MTKAFFSDSLKESLRNYKNADDLDCFFSDDISGYDGVSQAQYIEIKTLLSGYLLSSQGDRVAMAHSVEGRFPFLDHRVIEFCCKLPPTIRLKTLEEKYILKRSMCGVLPPAIIERTKQPYMSPDAKSFFPGKPLDYVAELLSERYLEESGYFDPKRVSFLTKKCRQSRILGFKDNMAIVGIISTLLVHDHFVKHFASTSSALLETVPEDNCHAGKV